LEHEAGPTGSSLCVCHPITDADNVSRYRDFFPGSLARLGFLDPAQYSSRLWFRGTPKNYPISLNVDHFTDISLSSDFVPPFPRCPLLRCDSLLKPTN